MQIPQFIKKLTGLSLLNSASDDAYNDLIRQSAQIGGKLFGTIPKNHTRQFFCLDRDTWVWHEEWKDETGKNHVDHFQYRLFGNNVVKVFPNGSTHQLKNQELINLYQAINIYAKVIPAQLVGQ